MTDEAVNPYDAVLYPGDPFPQTHPDRLGTIASLFGMQPARVSHCRVLELGCGVGGNLIPMAAQWPRSEFVGVDLSGRSVEHGQENAAALGLTNVVLRHGDIMDIGPADGKFDFIIAHGVYSWVPPAVRAKILAICGANLTRQGVAFISFNAYPGCRRRNVMRDIMRYHTRGVTDPEQQVRQGRAISRFFAQWAGDDIYGAVLREQADWVAGTPDAPIYHDDLADIATPYLLHQVAADAAAAGLQYLAEGTFAHSSYGRHPEHARRLMAQIPPDQFVMREQLLDFMIGRTFREALFCHADVPLERSLAPALVRNFRIAGNKQVLVRGTNLPAPQDSAPPSAAVAAPSTAVIQPAEMPAGSEAIIMEAMRIVREAWPQAVGYADLIDAAFKDKTLAASVREDAKAALDGILFRAFCADMVSLHLESPRAAPAAGARPTASAVARRQALGTKRVATLHHSTTDLDDARLRRCLVLADGTRDVDEIATDLSRWAADEGDTGAVTREQVEHCLKELADRALLAA